MILRIGKLRPALGLLILLTLAAKLREFHFGPNLDEMKDLARDKGHLAGRYDETRGDADALFRAAGRQ